MSRKNRKTNKSSEWFIKVRGSYLPNNGAGWLSYIPFMGFLIAVPFLAWANTDNLVIASLITIPNWIASATIMTYIASHKS